MQKIQAFVMAGLFGMAACGGDDGAEHGSGGANASNAALCERLCTRAVSKHCDDSTKEDCESTCMEQAATTPSQCSSLVHAFLSCSAKADFQCDDRTGDADAIGCLNQLNALQTCYDQYAVDEDDDGNTGKTPTPTPGTGNGGGGTPTTGKPGTGGTGQPGTGGTGGGTNTPGGANLCAPAADDDACDSCSKTSCCAAMSACANDASCGKLSACLNACADSDVSCQQACVDNASSTAFDALSAMVSCFQDHCSNACGDSDDGDDTSNDTNDGGTANNGEPEGCLPTGVPAGYCTDAKRPVGHECHNVTPPGDCVALENVSDVFCCAK